MAKIQDTDLLVVNRAGVDYKSPKSELGIPTKVGELENDKGYITAGEVPDVDLDGYATEEWVEQKYYAKLDDTSQTIYAGEFRGDHIGDGSQLTNLPEVDLDGYATEEWVEGKNYITLEDVPEPDLEGALIFKGTVENEGALPDDAAQGDLYYNEADQHLYAKGETEWHKLDTIDDIDLSEYAKLDDQQQSITAKEFIGDGSKLTNLPFPDLEGGYVGGPLETSPTAPAQMITHTEEDPIDEYVVARCDGPWHGIWVGTKLASDAGWVWDSSDGEPNIVEDKPTVIYINGIPFDVDFDHHEWGNGEPEEALLYIPFPGDDEDSALRDLCNQEVIVSWYPASSAGALDGYAKLDGAEFTGAVSVPELTVGPDSDGKNIIYLDTNELEAKEGSGGLSDWTGALTPDSTWKSVAYGGGKFVAIANSGTNRVMYSEDGINWTPASAAEEKFHGISITYGNGKFVALQSGGTDGVMYSEDGINWTSAEAAGERDSGWSSVTYGNGKFVATSYDVDDEAQVMYSEDGINWTAVSPSVSSGWYRVTYGGGKFVAVATTGTYRVMYSEDGINWTGALAAENNKWHGITYGGGKFVALSENGTNRIMYSEDAINWKSASVPNNSNCYWGPITYGDGLFVATANWGYGSDRAMYSSDGINWKEDSPAENNSWQCVTYGDGKFVAVANDGTNRAMCATAEGGFAGKGLYFNGARLLTEDNLEDGDDVDLTPYAKLDDDEQSITAKEFIGDGSQLTNLNAMPKDISTLPSLPSLN